MAYGGPRLGYRDRPLEANPARSLRGARLRKTDRPKVDPFCMQDAEVLIAAIHRDWGEAQGNYDEFRFFTGLQPSEQIALVLTDLDVENGIISISRHAFPESIDARPKPEKIGAYSYARGRYWF